MTVTAGIDLDLVSFVYQAIASQGPDDFVCSFMIPGAPPSKARPRFGHGRAYTPAEQRTAEDLTALYVARSIKKPLTGNVALGCVFFRPNRQRIDCDNLMKHVCDAANGVAWLDDSQVTTTYGRVELDAENPRTLVVIAADESTMQRGSDAWYPCEQCGARIDMARQTNYRKTCSKECAIRARGYRPLADPIPCEWCQQPYRRTNKYQRFCSPECGRSSLRGNRKNAAGPPVCCADCGTELSHRRGGHCRRCWRERVRNGGPK